MCTYVGLCKYHMHEGTKRSEGIRTPKVPNVGARNGVQVLSSPTNIIFILSLLPRLSVLSREPRTRTGRPTVFSDVHLLGS